MYVKKCHVCRHLLIRLDYTYVNRCQIIHIQKKDILSERERKLGGTIYFRPGMSDGLFAICGNMLKYIGSNLGEGREYA